MEWPRPIKCIFCFVEIEEQSQEILHYVVADGYAATEKAALLWASYSHSSEHYNIHSAFLCLVNMFHFFHIPAYSDKDSTKSYEHLLW